MANFKGVLVILTAFLFLKCEKSAVEESDEGMIIGEWEGYSRTVVYKDESKETLPNDNCEGLILNFHSDGDVRWVDFNMDGNGSCVEDQNTEPMGKWERVSNGKYVFTLTNSSDGSKINIVPDLISFYSNGATTMEIRYFELPDNVSKDAVYYYLTLFKRQQ